MTNPEALQAMTVVQLRKFAKDSGITLGTVTSKADIIDRISQALRQLAAERGIEPPQPKQPEQEQKPPVRRAVIITDTGEEPPQPITPPRPRPVPSTKAPASGTSAAPKGNKPAFTLQGARAWHNPQPFAAPQPPAPKYAPQPGQAINTYPAGQLAADGQSLITPIRQVPTAVSRFGPSAARTEEPAREDSPPRPQSFTAQGMRRYPIRRQEYQRGALTPPAFQSQDAGYQPVRQPAYPGAYQRPVSDVPEQAEEQGYTPSPLRPREAGVSPAIPEMLATGDCGDGAGVLEIHADGYGFLRAGNYLPGKNDVYVSNAQIRRFRLRDGDYVEGKTRPQRENDRYAAMLYITRINGVEAEEVGERKDFDELTPIYPDRKLQLSSAVENDMVLRLIDMFAPIGYGQRAMIVAAPKAGKTTILKKIALAIRRQHPDIHLMMLLVDERPEEVTDLKETIGGDVLHSTFDEPAESHVRVSELVLERAMRLVEQGKDVVVLMDSLTRLSRAYNTLAPSSARVMSGGLAAGVLNKPKRFFGAARNIREGGSLTIIATALVSTGSRMDEVIFEEFKGTGNMELTLDRGLSEMRVFPAVSIARSGTRHDELLLTPEELQVTNKVRALVSGSSEQDGISLILSMMEKTKDNEDFVARYDDWVALMKGGSR